MSMRDTRSDTVVIDDPVLGREEHRVDGLVLALGAFGAARIAGLNFREFGFDMPLQHRVIDLVVPTHRRTDLCYFYGMDPEHDYYRVTNYAAFAGDPDDPRVTEGKGFPPHPTVG